MSPKSCTLRPYSAADEDAAVELWRRTWQKHYAHIDFNARIAWWRNRWRNELVPAARIMLADIDGALAGFVTVDPKTTYLDQIVVAPEHWGSDVALALLIHESSLRIGARIRKIEGLLRGVTRR